MGDLLLAAVGEPDGFQRLLEGSLRFDSLPALLDLREDIQEALLPPRSATPEVRYAA